MADSLLRSSWPLRVVWVALPVLLGPALGDALADHSKPVQLVGSLMAWGLWGVALGAMAIPRTSTLTAIRLVVPGALPLALWSATDSDTAWSSAAGVASAIVALVLLAVPGLSDIFVDGSSYGAERRVALKVPLALLLLPVPLSWAVAATVIVAGPMLLATERWLLGAVTLLLGAVAVAAVLRQLHLLSQRWLVFVPAGVVVHDPLELSDAVLFPRRHLARFGPALADVADDALDVTGGALGLVVEIRSEEPVTVGLRSGREVVERPGVRAVLVSPTRPAATLEIARESRLPVA